MAMSRKPVNSSLLTSVGYDKKKKILEVEFTSGTVYQYIDVPVEEYEALISADSLGQYFNWNIRKGYSYIQIR